MWKIAVQGLGDPCKAGAHRELSDIRRSTGFKTAFPEVPLCDEDLKPGWYRFNNETGGKMPEHCVDKMSCGTVVPVWLNGTHPTVADGIVERKACAHFDSGNPQGSSCCRHTVQIGVKNCGNFFVYQLHPTPSCPMAYCAGSKPPCPVGQWSPTGFPPNCEVAYPKMNAAPELKGPIIDGKTFHFACEINYSGHDGDAAFEVAWTLDGNDTAGTPSTTLYGSDRVAKLDGTKLAGHLGYNLGCKVRPFFRSKATLRGPWLESHTYWVGIRAEPSHLTFSQAVQEQNVSLTSTLPVLCDHDLDCCVMVKVDINGPRDKVVVAHNCRSTMCTDMWDDASKSLSVDFKVVATKSQIVDGSSDLLLTFDELIGAGGGPYQDVFTGYRVQSVQVEVEQDPPVTCTLVTDPHITGIDLKRPFNVYRVGDYTAYESPSRHFEVQVRTWPCNGGRVTCICGVAIREKDDLIRIHGCDKSYYSTGIGSPELEVVRPLREGTNLMRSTDGHEISVYFPSGSDVTVKGFSAYGGHMNVYITIPSMDKGKGQGLCGTYDGITTNDFTHKDGTQERPCARQYCTPESFTESWKNSRSDSLFRMVPPAVNEAYVPKYCACDDANKQINCTLHGDIPKPPCSYCVRLPGVWITNRQHRSADGDLYVDVDDDKVPPFDPDDYANFQPAKGGWPTPSGITEAQAEARCRQAIQGSQLWSHCHGQTESTNNNIDSCKEDIMYGDSFDSVGSIADAFTKDCQTELAKDPTNYVNSTDGGLVLKPVLSTDVCSQVCLAHGRCERGRCVCNAGYTGDSCQLIAGQGPQLKGGDRLCDINQRPCRLLYLEASNIQLSDKLTCKVQEILPNGQGTQNGSTHDAEFVHSGKLACHLPDARVKS
ncbi:hypothetical protein BaRGS_00036865, partial [Batillaria attramentaria]